MEPLVRSTQRRFPLILAIALPVLLLMGARTAFGSELYMVELPMAESFRPDSTMSSSTRALQRHAIQMSQDRVMQALATKPYGVHRRFKTIPFLSLELSEEQAADLVAAGLVTRAYVPPMVYPSLSQSIPNIGADGAHSAGFDGSGQVIVIMDTGLDANHSAFGGRVVTEACFTSTQSCPNGGNTMFGPGAAQPCVWNPGACIHGTHVAGIAAGGGPMPGVAPGAGIIGVQVFSNSGGQPAGQFADILAGLEWVLEQAASYPIAAVNLSLGTGPRTPPCDSAFPAIEAAFANLVAAGIAPVVASGNSSSATGLGSPACLSSAVSVGCSTDSDAICGFSNSAPALDLLAPGSGITAPLPNEGTGTLSGTSMSAPHVSGAIALLFQRGAVTTVDEAVSALATSGEPLLDTRNGTITPRIQVDAALGLDPVQGGPCIACAPTCEGAPTTGDEDGDGEIDANDRCSSTSPAALVDDSGCSISQFCALYDPTARGGRRECRHADWKNDRAIGRGMDCYVDKAGTGFDLTDDRCVPR